MNMNGNENFTISSWASAKGKTLRDFCSLMLTANLCTPSELENILLNSSIGTVIDDNKLIMSVDAMSLLFLLALEDPMIEERIQKHSDEIKTWNNRFFHGDVAGWVGWVIALAAHYFNVKISDIIVCASMDEMINYYWKPYHCVSEIWICEEIYKPALIERRLIPSE